MKTKEEKSSIQDIEIQILLFDPEVKSKWGNTHNQIFKFLNKAFSEKTVNKIKQKFIFMML